MKKTLWSIALLCTGSLFADDVLTGTWRSQPSAKGNTTTILFKADNSFEGFANKKAFATGYYTLKDGIFSFTDNGCNGMQGVYKLVLFSNKDSLRFECISDSCEERKQGVSRMVLGRVKNN